MKLSFKQAHQVVYLILSPIWIIKIIFTPLFYISLFPIWLYDVLWRKLNNTIFWDMQGMSRDFEERVGWKKGDKHE